MKVLLCLCAWIAAATAHGVISYPVAPVTYHSTYLPLTPVARPVSVVPLPYFSYNVIPNNVFYNGFPGFVHYIPLEPANGKGKPDKKPDKKAGGKDEKKEETTEEPKKEEEEGETKADESEDLAH